MDGWIYQSDALEFYRLLIYCLFKLSFIYGIIIIAKVTWTWNVLERTYGRSKESVHTSGDK
jgi:hypothetical protein